MPTNSIRVVTRQISVHCLRGVLGEYYGVKYDIDCRLGSEQRFLTRMKRAT